MFWKTIVCSEIMPVLQRDTDTAIVVILSASLLIFLIYLAIKVYYKNFYQELFYNFYRIASQGTSFFSESNTGQQQARMWVQIASSLSISTALMSVLLFSPFDAILEYPHPVILWFLCLGFIISIIYSKWLVYRFAAWLFSLEKPVNTYISTIMNVIKVAGLIIFPFSLLVPILGETISNILSISILSLFAITILYTQAMFIWYSFKIKFLNHYAILYFCTLEILPILFLIKILRGI